MASYALSEEKQVQLKNTALAERRKKKTAKRGKNVNTRPKQPTATKIAAKPVQQARNDGGKQLSWRDSIIKGRQPAAAQPQSQAEKQQSQAEKQSAQEIPAKPASQAQNYAGKQMNWRNAVKGDSHPEAAVQLQAPREPAKPTQSWYSVCAKQLWDGEGDALAVFLERLFDNQSSDDDLERTKSYECIAHLFDKPLQNTGKPLPKNLTTLWNNFEKVADKRQFTKVWNVLNDPSQQFILNVDDIVMEALCIIFEAKIIFVDAEKNRHVWSVEQIYEDVDVHISIRFYYDGEIPRAYQYDEQEERDCLSCVVLGHNPGKPRQPTPLWRPPTAGPQKDDPRPRPTETVQPPARERRGDPSAASEAFLGTLRNDDITIL